MFHTGSYGRRIAWSIAAVAVLAGFAAAAWRWRGRLKRELKEWTRSNASRVAEAEGAYQGRDWARALELSRALLRSMGKDPSVRRLSARMGARMERGDAALVYGALMSSPAMQPEDYFLFGLVQLRSGNPEAALETWEQGAAQQPDHPELLECLARLSVGMQRPDRAAAAARALARQPGWEARGFLLVGEAEDLMDDPEAAARAIGQGLELDPRAKGAPFSAGHYQKLLARNLLALGRPAAARAPLEAIDASTGLPGADPEASWLASRSFLQEGRLAEAARALVLAGTYRALAPLVPEPSPCVGAARCASCHPKETQAHERSRHARTFHRGAALLALPLPDQPVPDPADPECTYTFSRENGRIHAKTRASDGVADIVVEYAFGTPDRCVTMVGRDGPAFRAARLSSYHKATGVSWDLTCAHDPEAHVAGDFFRGQPIPSRSGALRCLWCHVTRPSDFRDRPRGASPGPEAADAGIGCERCHGPGGNHLAAVAAGFADRAIATRGKASAASIITQCAHCHVVDPPGEIVDAPEDPRFVRSSGLTLTLSRCFAESNGRLGCLTCHDPHRDDGATAAFYEGKCRGCHSFGATPAPAVTRQDGEPATPAATQPAVCRVNAAKDCITCHMPKVALAPLHNSFTDHFIRVRKDAGTTK
jgi:tetratricopeptide (TPR) repeat protein